MAEFAHIVGPEIRSSSTAVPGLTSKLWRGIDPVSNKDNPERGFFHLERGQSGTAIWTATQAGSAGTANLIAGPAGFGTVLELDSDSTTNTQGIQVQAKGLGCTPTDGMLIGWETMMRADDIATFPEVFAGLSGIDTTIIASGAMSAADWAGFYDVSDGTLSFGVEDGTQDISANTAHLLVDGVVTTTSWVRLGLRWEVGSSIEAYVNGLKVDTSDVAESNAPDGFVCASYVMQTNGTTDPILLVAYTAFGFRRA